MPIDRPTTQGVRPQPQHGKHTAEIGTHASTCGGMDAQHCTRAGQSLLLHTVVQYHVRNRAITVIPGLEVDIGIHNGESESTFLNSVVLVAHKIKI